MPCRSSAKAGDRRKPKPRRSMRYKSTCKVVKLCGEPRRLCGGSMSLSAANLRSCRAAALSAQKAIVFLPRRLFGLPSSDCWFDEGAKAGGAVADVVEIRLGEISWE